MPRVFKKKMKEYRVNFTENYAYCRIFYINRSYAVGPLHIVFSNPLNIRINLMCIVDYLNMLSLPLS